MELRGIVIATGTVIVTVQLGLFAWLKADIGAWTGLNVRSPSSAANSPSPSRCSRKRIGSVRKVQRRSNRHATAPSG